jgi:hypothetical protein
MVGVAQRNWTVASQMIEGMLDSAPLAATAEARLHHTSYLDLRRVSCHFVDGVLTLRGQVPSYHLKQIAQTLVGTLEGVECICNLLDVGLLPAPDETN